MAEPRSFSRTISEAARKVRGSFTPPSVLLLCAGFVLAFCGGYVNAVTFYDLASSMGPVDGALTRLAGSAAVSEGVDFRADGLALAGFFGGCLYCGLLIANNQPDFRKSQYGLVLLGNATLLVTAIIIRQRVPNDDLSSDTAKCLIAAACGMQNGMCCLHFGTVIRTTSMSGIVTDFGTHLGRTLATLVRNGCAPSRASALDRAEFEDTCKRMQGMFVLILGFSLGALVGTHMETKVGVAALWLPACITGVSGMLCVFFREQLKRHIKSLHQSRRKRAKAKLQSARTFLAELRDELRDNEDKAEQELELCADADALEEHVGQVLEVVQALECFISQDGETGKLRRRATF